MSEAKQADPAEVARMATAHASAVHLKVGPVFETAVWGWLPKLGGKVVRLKGGPENGYPTRQSAVDAAREFRDLCRAAKPVPAPVTLVPDTVAGGSGDDLLAEAEKLARRLKAAPSMFAADMEAMTDRLIARVREVEAGQAALNRAIDLRDGRIAEHAEARDAAMVARDAAWRAQVAFRDAVVAIADDFQPDNDAQAPQALAEMRDALHALLAGTVTIAPPADLAAEAAGDAVARGIYVASRASIPERGAMWRRLRSEGWPIISTWIDEDEQGATDDFGDLWSRICREVTNAAALILYAEPDDFPLKGAYIEVGMALAAGVPVYVVSPGVVLEPRSLRPLGSWMMHPLVTFGCTLEWAAAAIRARAGA